ncbi:cadherin-like beta sandwich domain-containing protein [Velocimicrobium porci]|uniref:Cadherin-like beta-sandwich-like domain-containing protein n=1 Tax=Velocimicrobium porci TaxID=2606634 RepID=A0A6L5XV34_9FIRM|nr:cadherin-like beta sandwich domain-containing protein [Velocimicrobium porci]MSS62572.1 hypothetical protein [Velocimicrobium porci]
MKEKKIHIWLIVCILSVSGFLLSGTVSLAASATISLTEPGKVVKSGDTFTVVVLIESSEEIGNVEAFVSFDTKMVSFKSGGLYATGGDGLVMISDWNSSGESKRKKYPLTFEAKKNGTCKFEVENDASIYDSSEVSMSVSSVNLSMEIGETKKTAEQETVNNPEVKEQTKDKGVYPALETLTISDGILAPLFEPEVYEYKVVVDSTVDKIGVSAIPKNKGDKVVISGNEALQEGKNEIVISLTSSLGRTKKYTIEVTKNASKESDESVEKEKLSGIHCNKEDGKIKLTQFMALTIEEANEDELLKGYEKTSLRMDGITVPAYMKSNDWKSKLFLLYGTDEEGNTGFFQYNSATKTIQPYQLDGTSEDKTEQTDSSNDNMQLIVVIVILGIVCTILSVILALQFVKKKAVDDEDDDIFKDFKY